MRLRGIRRAALLDRDRPRPLRQAVEVCPGGYSLQRQDAGAGQIRKDPGVIGVEVQCAFVMQDSVIEPPLLLLRQAAEMLQPGVSLNRRCGCRKQARFDLIRLGQ